MIKPSPQKKRFLAVLDRAVHKGEKVKAGDRLV
jgi:hypothetical protein